MTSKVTTSTSATSTANDDNSSGIDFSSDSGEISDGEIVGSDDDEESLESEPQQPRLAPNFMYQPQTKQPQSSEESCNHSEAALTSSKAVSGIGFNEDPFFNPCSSSVKPDEDSSKLSSMNFGHDTADTSSSFGPIGFYKEHVNPFYVDPNSDSMINQRSNSGQASFSVKDKDSHNNSISYSMNKSDEGYPFAWSPVVTSDPFKGLFNWGAKSGWSALDRSINPFYQPKVSVGSNRSSLLGPPPDECPIFEASTPNDPDRSSRKFVYLNPAKLSSLFKPPPFVDVWTNSGTAKVMK